MNTSYQFKSKLFKRYFKAVFLLLAIDSALFADRMISTHNKTMNWVVKVSTQLFIKRADENTSQRNHSTEVQTFSADKGILSVW